MHDEMIERRLRATLREDAGQLPFTITAAELERRLVLRNRSLGGRRLGLLLAAAVGIGLVGIGGAMGGMFDDPTPSPLAPSPIAEATGPAPTTSPSVPRTLPSLDEMIAARDPGSVVLAQAHTPFDPSVGEPSALAFGDPSVALGPLPRGEYDIELACSGGRGAAVLTGPGLPAPVVTRPCDGSIQQSVVGLVAQRSLQLVLVDTEAWRVVVRRVGGAAVVPGETPATMPDAGGRQVLNLAEALTISDGPVWPGTDLPFAELEGLPGRLAYEVDVSCVGSHAVRYIFGEEINGELIGVTTTQLPCDGALHHARLDLAQPFGTRMYVAAEAGAIVSLMVSAEQPPVALVRELPGWQLSAGAGPDLAFDTGTQVFTGPGVEGGGPIAIAVSCAGTGTIEVTVRLQHSITPQVTEDEYAQFDAPCEPGGATSQSFATADEYVDVEWTTAAGSWVAVSILVPDPLPSPR